MENKEFNEPVNVEQNDAAVTRDQGLEGSTMSAASEDGHKDYMEQHFSESSLEAPESESEDEAVQDSEQNSRPKTLSNALDGLSDRMNNKFDMMDVRKKGVIILSIAAIAFIMGMVYLYIFLSKIL